MQTVDHVKVHVKKDKGKAVGICARVLALKHLGRPNRDKIKQYSKH